MRVSTVHKGLASIVIGTILIIIVAGSFSVRLVMGLFGYALINKGLQWCNQPPLDYFVRNFLQRL